MKYELVCIFSILFLLSGLIFGIGGFYKLSAINLVIGMLLIFYEMKLYDDFKRRNLKGNGNGGEK